MSATKIIFWATTGLLFLTQGIMPILTTNSEETKTAMTHLGYPVYFGLMLAIFKLAGGISIIIPKIPAQIKEWSYGCFAVEFIAACWSIIATEGFNATALFPIVAIAILATSYWSYHKLKANKIST